jgi:AraC family transcriptional regulator
MPDDVEVRTLAAVRVAYLRHVGPYGSPGITETWRRFEAWCRTRGLPAAGRRMFGVAQDNPNITPTAVNRYDACVEVDETFRSSGEIGVQVVRGGRFACVPFRGTAAELRAAWVKLFVSTLPEAGLEPEIVPALELYEEGLAVDETGAFSCTLCMPLRAA